MNRAVGIAVAAGLLSALLFVSLSQGLAVGVLLTYLAPLPLMMAGLARGTATAGVAGAVATVTIAVFSGGVASLPFGLAVAVPAVLVARQALLWRTTPSGAVEWYPPGLVLGWLTGMAVVLILLGAAVAAGQSGTGMESGGLQEWVSVTIGRTLDLMSPTLDVAQRQQVVEWWVPFFPALVGGSWLVMVVINATLAQALLSRSGHNRRPSPAYSREMDLPTWLGVGLAAALAVGVTVEGDLGYLARSLAVVALLPFALSGLAAAHGWAAGRPNARMLLVVVYGVLFLVSAWALLLLTGLGLVRFVTRFRPAGDSGGGKEK